MKRKNLISKIIILATAFMISCSIPAAASNYKDTTFDYYFRTSAWGSSTTEFREKLDDSSAYMKCDSTTYPYIAQVVAAQGFFDLHYDASGGHKYTFNSGTVYKMINYVYENNYKYAAIYAQRLYSYDYFASGLWSPDSI